MPVHPHVKAVAKIIDDDLMEEDMGYSQLVDGFGPTEFATALSQSLESHGTNAQKLFGNHGLLYRYQRIAQEKSLPPKTQLITRAEQYKGSPKTAEWWTLETRLWDLIRRLYEFRHTLANQQPPLDPAESSLEETRVILKWLTDTAPRITQPEYIQSNRWFVTRENLKMRKVTAGRTSLAHNNDPVVSELDPDAPLRQGKVLMLEDEENERKLLKQVFAYLRLGDVKGAEQVCRDSNNFWRAASFSASSGPELNNNWRKMCFQIARQPQVEKYEKAVYGVVCGDLDSVVSVCQTWEDQLWAHFNAIYTWKMEEV